MNWLLTFNMLLLQVPITRAHHSQGHTIQNSTLTPSSPPSATPPVPAPPASMVTECSSRPPKSTNPRAALGHRPRPLDTSEAEFELDVYLKNSPYSVATALEPLITSDVHHFYLHTALTHPSLGQKSYHDWETQQTENSTQRRDPRGIADEYALPGHPDC